jgi:putative endonuclease
MDPRPEIGRRGESVAARHLEARGWVVAASRWKGVGGELDLVAHRSGVLAFCEVKVRTPRAGDYPAVSASQRRRIIAGAQSFLDRHPRFAGHEVHLDLLLVHPGPGRWRVEHVPRALEC